MIVECLQHHAIEKPDETFLVDDVVTLSFRDAEQQARQLAGVLRRDGGIVDGSAVYLYDRDSARLVVALLATQYCGARVCILNHAERTKERLSAAKAKGHWLGRPKGSLGKSKLDGKEAEITKFPGKDVSKSSIAKIVEVSRTALLHFIRSRNLDPKAKPARSRRRA